MPAATEAPTDIEVEIAAFTALDTIMDSGQYPLACEKCTDSTGFKKNVDRSRRRRYVCKPCGHSFTWRVAEQRLVNQYDLPRPSEQFGVQPLRTASAPRPSKGSVAAVAATLAAYPVPKGVVRPLQPAVLSRTTPRPLHPYLVPPRPGTPVPAVPMAEALYPVEDGYPSPSPYRPTPSPATPGASPTASRPALMASPAAGGFRPVPPTSSPLARPELTGLPAVAEDAGPSRVLSSQATSGRPTAATPPASPAPEVEEEYEEEEEDNDMDEGLEEEEEEAMDQLEAMPEHDEAQHILVPGLAAAIDAIVAERLEQTTATLQGLLLEHLGQLRMHQPLVPGVAAPAAPARAPAAPAPRPAALPINPHLAGMLEETANKFKPSERAGVREALAVVRLFAPKPARPPYQAEEEYAYRTVYVKGFAWEPISTIRKALYSLRFFRSRIRNLSWLGHYVLEVVVDADYYLKFQDQVRAVPGLSVAEDFSPLGGGTEEDKAQALDRFLARTDKIIQTTQVKLVRDFFMAWRDEVSANVDGRAVGGGAGGCCWSCTTETYTPTSTTLANRGCIHRSGTRGRRGG